MYISQRRRVAITISTTNMRVGDRAWRYKWNGKETITPSNIKLECM